MICELIFFWLLMFLGYLGCFCKNDVCEYVNNVLSRNGIIFD